MSKRVNRKKQSLLIIGTCLLLVTSVFAFFVYSRVFKPNLNLADKELPYLFIPTGSDFDDVVSILENRRLLNNQNSFRWLAKRMHYDEIVRPGKYKLKSKMNNKDLVSLLRSGIQEPVKLTFNTIRLKDELAQKVAEQIEAPSSSIINLLEDEDYVAVLGFSSENALCMFIPNTYEFYWNTSADQFLRRMKKEYDKFWNETRLQQAAGIGLTPTEVSILASIVQKETNFNDEKRVVAGVYLNRLKKNMKLEADPTLVFALGNFSVNRVLSVYKEIDSPYNTYMYSGLPPGPICLPEISSLKAVLDYAKHNYLYFCAKDDFSGRHSFAASYNQHLVNARRFQRALDNRGIKS